MKTRFVVILDDANGDMDSGDREPLIRKALEISQGDYPVSAFIEVLSNDGVVVERISQQWVVDMVEREITQHG